LPTSSDPAIRVEGLGKQYRLGQVQGLGTLRETLTEGVKRPFNRRQRDAQEVVERRVWALRDVSFDVAQGEVIGVIGSNGAGKSTLLKILSRISEPTEGAAEIRGRVGSLLEVGTGFHPQLTGRENVYLNGIVLGMRRSEIRERFDEIVEFAGVQKFMDTPVKRYSSGMQVRLGFAVAAHLQPEILLVDEVLAVGDAEFQRKCIGKMKDVTDEGRTILFVSHNMTAIRSLCRRTVLIESGQVAFDGDTATAVDRYLKIDDDSRSQAVLEGEELERRATNHLFYPDELFRCTRISLVDADGMPRNAFESNERITIAIDFDVFQPIANLDVVVTLTDENEMPLLRSENVDDPGSPVRVAPGHYRSQCVLPADLFGERRLYLGVGITSHETQHFVLRRALQFDISFEGYNDNLSPHSKQAYFRPRLEWQINSLP